MSNNKSVVCPPLSMDDILNLRGEPVVKKRDIAHRSPAVACEEWVYFCSRTNNKEHYYFRNGHLSGYKAGGARRVGG